MRNVAVIALGVACAATLAAPPAAAAQKVGCPASSKWERVSLDEAAGLIMLEANNNGYETVEEAYAVLDATYDKNENDSICVDRKPDRNPHSDVIWYYLRDDNSNGG
jgi:ABC-type sugar transport system substrate-binding protein